MQKMLTEIETRVKNIEKNQDIIKTKCHQIIIGIFGRKKYRHKEKIKHQNENFDEEFK